MFEGKRPVYSVSLVFFMPGHLYNENIIPFMFTLTLELENRQNFFDYSHFCFIFFFFSSSVFTKKYLQ